MENEKELMLQNSGFILDNGEWKKDYWVIRIEGDSIEAFNNRKYFYGDISDLEIVLDDIG